MRLPGRQLRWCETCREWTRLPLCVVCGNLTTIGRITREEKPADPRVRGPEPNRKVKPI